MAQHIYAWRSRTNLFLDTPTMTTRTASAAPTPPAYATGCRPSAARIACRSAASPTAASTPASRPSGSGTISSRHWASKRSNLRCLASSAWHRRHRSMCATSSARGSPPASSWLSISRATCAQSSKEGSSLPSAQSLSWRSHVRLLAIAASYRRFRGRGFPRPRPRRVRLSVAGTRGGDALSRPILRFRDSSRYLHEQIHTRRAGRPARATRVTVGRVPPTIGCARRRAG